MQTTAFEGNEIKLTQSVKKGGCAAKVSALTLRKILGGLEFPKAHPELLVGTQNFDDAAVYKITEELAIVQTLDFFTPIVDSPRLFGRIAATNALSDVYAMGGIPKTCMGILAFPISVFPETVAQEVLQGACDAISLANANLVGGHSIDDDTLKFGLSVTGFVHPKQIWTNAGAQVGDVLILTKALGTGTLCAGLKRGEYKESDIQEALDSMSQLNDLPARLNDSPAPLLSDSPAHRSAELKNNIHAATDVTGFGLSGHSLQMARASQVCLEIRVSKLPTFELTHKSLEKEFLTKAHASNREYTKDDSDWSTLKAIEQLVIHDPQTSGGLLLSVSESSADEILKLARVTFPKAAIIGKVSAAGDKFLRFL